MPQERGPCYSLGVQHSHLHWRERLIGPAAAATLAAIVLASCGRDRDTPPIKRPPPSDARPQQRQRAAAVVIRFDNGRSAAYQQGGGGEGAEDRLQIAAVFGDIDNRDANLLSTLTGQTTVGAEIPGLDTCMRQPEAARATGLSTPTDLSGWAQLLDVGNLELRAGVHRLPLRVQLLPAVVEAARGVRYDFAQDRARALLSASPMQLVATGGDGVAAFEAAVSVPRPVRITHVGPVVVRQGSAQGVPGDEDLRLRWGSVDGTADLEVRVGSEEPGSLGWVRCRLRDDGEFAIPASLTADLPVREPRRPWLVVLVRRRSAAIPGFAGQPLRLELADSVHVY